LKIFCVLNSAELAQIKDDASDRLSILFKSSDMPIFFLAYKNGDIFQGFETLDKVNQFGLFTSILGITNPMQINPPSLDKFFPILSDKINITLPFTFSVNKPIVSCQVVSETPQLLCELTSDTTFKVFYHVEDLNFLTEVFVAKIAIQSDAPPQEVEIRQVSLVFRALNLNKLLIPGLIVLSIGGIFLFMFLKRKKIKLSKVLKG